MTIDRQLPPLEMRLRLDGAVGGNAPLDQNWHRTAFQLSRYPRTADGKAQAYIGAMRIAAPVTLRVLDAEGLLRFPGEGCDPRRGRLG